MVAAEDDVKMNDRAVINARGAVLPMSCKQAGPALDAPGLQVTAEGGKA